MLAIAVHTASTKSSASWSGLVVLALLVGAFLLGRKRGRNQASARSDAAAVAAIGDVGGGDASAAGRAESGVTLVLNMGAGEAQSLLPAVERLVHERYDDDHERGITAARPASLRPGDSLGIGGAVLGSGRGGDAAVRSVLPSGVPAVDVDRLYALDDYGRAADDG